MIKRIQSKKINRQVQFKYYVAISFFLLLSLNTIKGNNYYVNDGTTTGDLYCSTIGVNSTGKGTSASEPARTLRWLFTTYGASFTTGDTIFIDAGTYGRGGPDATADDSKFDITTAGLTFKGAGIGVTVFDNNGYGTNTDYFMEISANNTRLLDFTIQEYEGGASNSGTTVAGVNTGGQAISMMGATGIVLQNIQTSNNGGNGNAAITVSPNTSALITGGGSTCNAYGGMYSGGIDVFGGNINLTIQNTILAYNSKTTGYYGGGLYIAGNNSTTIVTLNNVRIHGNTAIEGGAVFINGGNLTIRNSIVSSNTITGSGIYGGGICITSGIVRVAKSKLINNNGSKGAGIAVNPSNGNVTLTVDSCFFSGNTASSSGADIYARPSSVNEYAITCSQNTFSNANPSLVENDASTNTCVGSDFTITDSGNPITLSTNGGGGSSCGVNKTNTNVTTYTANPNPPNFSGTCGSLVILPIELVNFQAVCHSGDAFISWQTASEKNNDYFFVERSVDAIEFSTVGIVDGSGDSQVSKSYSFIDKEKPGGIVYYRLGQQDFDGNVSKSAVVYLDKNCNTNADIVINTFPNPMVDQLTIDITAFQQGTCGLSIYNTIGQQVWESSLPMMEKGLNSIIVETSQLKSGIYFLRIKLNDRIEISKLLKN
jgi:hypothetical protein